MTWTDDWMCSPPTATWSRKSAASTPTQHYRQPAQLFWNRGDPKGFGFLPVTADKCGDDLFKPIVGRGSAFADIDGDGDLDVVLAQIAGPPLLLRNDQKLGHHWIRLKLVGTKSNRDAIGAWVKVRVGDHTLSRQVMPIPQLSVAIRTAGNDSAGKPRKSRDSRFSGRSAQPKSSAPRRSIRRQ